ncbi:HAMP domain-containing sensor histidine kinase [Priestia megaterium]|uniref:sensor histidine kinase n=1 Tax=Priestia megaterium TaxID=1404 RepID=UPI002FFF1BBF
MNQIKEQIPPEEKSAENLGLVLNSTNHVLELSRRIQSKLDVINLKESEFSLTESIDSAINLLKPYLNMNPDITIIKQYEVDAIVFGDTEQLQETYLNIIKNASEAMNGQGVILIKVYKTRKKIHIDFIDEGKGIGKDELTRVLDPFYSTKHNQTNFGLGLTYCYNVLKKHGGDILVKSKVEKGTTFTLTLPSKRIIEFRVNEQSNSKLVGENSLWTK